MAFTFSVNQTPSTGSVAMYTFISALTTAGWSKIRDSDASTYSSSGTQVTSGAGGTNGLGNTNAWVVLRAPIVGSNTRSICIQRGTTDLLWRIKYSANAGFTGGTPSASQVPSATDEAVICGSGTDASPVGYAILGTNTSYRMHVVAGGAAEFYSFCLWCFTTGGTTATKFLFMDVLATGSFSALDVDPAIIGANNGTPVTSDFMNTNPTLTNPRPAASWFGATSSISNFQGVGIMSPQGLIPHTSGGYGNNPFSAKDVGLPCFWCRTSSAPTPNGPKGFSSLFRLNTTGRTNMDVFNVLGVRDFVYFQGLQIPWDGSIPVI